MDTAALKQTWARAQSLGDEVPLFFYSHLFLSHPELRSMFPVSMATQRDRLVGALGRIVSNVDELDEVTEFIQQLGRDHRRFEVIAAHYNAVGASLLATLKHFLGERMDAGGGGGLGRRLRGHRLGHGPGGRGLRGLEPVIVGR